jgi:hypothetical protein
MVFTTPSGRDELIHHVPGHYRVGALKVAGFGATNSHRCSVGPVLARVRIRAFWNEGSARWAVLFLPESPAQPGFLKPGDEPFRVEPYAGAPR